MEVVIEFGSALNLAEPSLDLRESLINFNNSSFVTRCSVSNLSNCLLRPGTARLIVKLCVLHANDLVHGFFVSSSITPQCLFGSNFRFLIGGTFFSLLPVKLFLFDIDEFVDDELEAVSEFCKGGVVLRKRVYNIFC